MANLLLSINDYFTSKELVVLLIVLFCGLLLFLIFMFVISQQKKRLQQNLNKVSCSSVYTIDLDKEIVTYFKVYSPSIRQTITYYEFCSMIEKREADNFKRWILETVKNTQFRRDYFICNDSKLKSTLLFKFVKNNLESKTLYLEMESFDSLSKAIISRNKSDSFLDEDNVIEYYRSLKKKKKKNVAIYFINTFDDLEMDDGNYSFRYLALLKLLNTIAPKLNKSVLFYFVNNYKLCIIDFNAKPQKVVEFANRLNELLGKIISFQSLSKLIDYRICVLTRFNYKSFNLRAKIRDAEDFSEYAKNSNDSEKLVYFNKNINLNASYHSVVVDELNRIIKFDAFKTIHKPYIDIKTGKIRGYLEKIQIDSSIINSYDSFEIEAYNQGKEQECLKLIIDKSFKEFKETTTKTKNRNLFIPIFFPFLASLGEEMLQDIDTPIVFIIEGTTLNVWGNSKLNANEILENVKKLGVQLALYVHDEKSFIAKDLLAYFSYVIFSEELISEVTPESLTRILLYEYIHINKDLEYIALGINSWQKTELYIMIGINYLAGPIIGQEKES